MIHTHLRVDSTGLGFNYGVANAVSIHPNPTNGIVTVSVQKETYDLEVVSVEGKVVHSSVNNSASTKLDLSPYDRGFYFVKITTTHGMSIHKIILE